MEANFAIPQPAAKLALSVKEAAAVSGISRSGLYIELQAGRLRARKIRGRTVILRGDLDAWLADAPTYDANKQAGTAA